MGGRWDIKMKRRRIHYEFSHKNHATICRRRLSLCYSIDLVPARDAVFDPPATSTGGSFLFSVDTCRGNNGGTGPATRPLFWISSSTLFEECWRIESTPIPASCAAWPTTQMWPDSSRKTTRMYQRHLKSFVPSVLRWDLREALAGLPSAFVCLVSAVARRRDVDAASSGFVPSGFSASGSRDKIRFTFAFGPPTEAVHVLTTQTWGPKL